MPKVAWCVFSHNFVHNIWLSKEIIICIFFPWLNSENVNVWLVKGFFLSPFFVALLKVNFTCRENYILSQKNWTPADQIDTMVFWLSIFSVGTTICLLL